MVQGTLSPVWYKNVPYQIPKNTRYPTVYPPNYWRDPTAYGGSAKWGVPQPRAYYDYTPHQGYLFVPPGLPPTIEGLRGGSPFHGLPGIPAQGFTQAALVYTARAAAAADRAIVSGLNAIASSINESMRAAHASNSVIYGKADPWASFMADQRGGGKNPFRDLRDVPHAPFEGPVPKGTPSTMGPLKTPGAMGSRALQAVLGGNVYAGFGVASRVLLRLKAGEFIAEWMQDAWGLTASLGLKNPGGWPLAHTTPLCTDPAHGPPLFQLGPDTSDRLLIGGIAPDDFVHVIGWQPFNALDPAHNYAVDSVRSFMPYITDLPARDPVHWYANPRDAQSPQPFYDTFRSGLPGPWPDLASFISNRVAIMPYGHVDAFRDARAMPGGWPLGLPEKMPLPYDAIPDRVMAGDRVEQSTWGPPPVPRPPVTTAPGMPPLPSRSGPRQGKPKGVWDALRRGRGLTPEGAKLLAAKAFSGVTEVSDVIGCGYGAIPKANRLRWRPGRPITDDEKAAHVARSLSAGNFNFGEFATCVVNNQLGDMVMGRLNAEAEKGLFTGVPSHFGLPSFWMPSQYGMRF